ncbi:MAG: MiaB/RimO family radical SAM methylthiotransferase, partial [Actinomycetota bacterium]|nr:MiaB/RimO family radical SAM methylthiotransferase [Actinomycetota bacterium]
LAEALPEVDALVDFAAYPRIAEIVDGAAGGTLVERVYGDPGTKFDPAYWDATIAGGPRVRFGRAPWAYVKIAEGCDRGCTFCAIPLMRGKFRSRSIETIGSDVRRLVAQGVTEISLVSQDSVMWGRDSGEGSLLHLLKSLERIEGLRRLRLMYLHPQGVTDELVDAMLGSDIVAPYFDLSLQHVSPRILRAMGRWGSRERFTRMIDRIREREPLAAIRSTFILGFPGEEDDDAAEVESFVADTALDWVGTFTYSPEEGTRSFDLHERVPDAVARERADRVTTVAEETMAERARSLVGTRLEVLAERLDVPAGTWTGRSYREAPEVDGEITFRAPHATGRTASAGRREVAVGDYVDVLVTGSEGPELSGHLG